MTGRTTATFAARWFSVLLLLLFAAAYASSQQQQEAKPTPPPTSQPKPAGNSQHGQPGGNTGRSGSSGDATNRRGTSPDGSGQQPSTTRPGQRPSPTPPAQGGSSGDATNRRGSPTNGGGQRGKPTDADNKGGGSGTVRPPARTDTHDSRNNGRTTRPDGSVVQRDKNGRTTSVTTPRGATARMDSRGRVVTIHDKRGNTISRGPSGERRVVTVRPDHTRVVSFGRGGYVERPFDRGGRPYICLLYTSRCV